MNWQPVFDYITEHALIIGISGSFALIGTTLGSITAHHLRKLRKKQAPKIYLSKVEKLELKAQKLREKKVAKTIGKFDNRTTAIFVSSAFKMAAEKGYTIQDDEKNVITNYEKAGLKVTARKTPTVLQLG